MDSSIGTLESDARLDEPVAENVEFMNLDLSVLAVQGLKESNGFRTARSVDIILIVHFFLC